MDRLFLRYTFGDRLMVGLWFLVPTIGVRIPVPELDLEDRLKIVFSFFVIGLANFLIWLPIVMYRLIEALRK